MRPDRTLATTLFREAFGKDPARLAVVPGRVELLEELGRAVAERGRTP